MKLYDPPIMSLGGGGAAILLEALIRIKTVISMSDISLDPCLELCFPLLCNYRVLTYGFTTRDPRPSAVSVVETREWP
jgi:hypothetical protein